MAGAGGRPKPKTFKCTMKNALLYAAVAQATIGVEPGVAAGAPAAEATAADPPAPAGRSLLPSDRHEHAFPVTDSSGQTLPHNVYH